MTGSARLAISDAADRAISPTSVEVSDLRKRYPQSDVEALIGVSFAVDAGEVFGLLGPNGAGKTTTIGVLTTRVVPTSGRASVAGVDVVAHPVAARARLGVVPQRNNLDRSLSIRQNLLFHAAYHGVAKADRERRASALLESFELADRAEQKPDVFSGGQGQRVMIARALMHDPIALFLDEPTMGLDPAARLFVWDRVRELRQRGTTVVLTTHDMDEAAALCDRVGIMDHGRLLALDTPVALTATLPTARVLELSVVPGAASEGDCRDAMCGFDGVVAVETVADPTGQRTATDDQAARPVRLRLSVTGDASQYVAPAAERLAPLGARLRGVSLGEASLEDVFIHLTGRALR